MSSGVAEWCWCLNFKLGYNINFHTNKDPKLIVWLETSPVKTHNTTKIYDQKKSQCD